MRPRSFSKTRKCWPDCSSAFLAALLLLQLAASTTIRCYSYDSDKDDKPVEVEGCKACVNVTLPEVGVYPYHTQFTEGCSYDEQDAGCRPVDANGTMCVCNDSDLCNGDGQPWPQEEAEKNRPSRFVRLF
ncbi:hypothetical protein M3Y99_01592600 [Aphelenchoides fujianensis]|nr:hypothetical protein M3Y99_01592600 [Aphelenchoides fujianensis]